MNPFLPWPALLWLLPFAPRGIAITRLGLRKLKFGAKRSERTHAERILKPRNLWTLKP